RAWRPSRCAWWERERRASALVAMAAATGRRRRGRWRGGPRPVLHQVREGEAGQLRRLVAAAEELRGVQQVQREGLAGAAREDVERDHQHDEAQRHLADAGDLQGGAAARGECSGVVEQLRGRRAGAPRRRGRRAARRRRRRPGRRRRRAAVVRLVEPLELFEARVGGHYAALGKTRLKRIRTAPMMMIASTSFSTARRSYFTRP